MRTESSDRWDEPDSPQDGLTCLGTHLVQQLHHALPLHRGPVFDGRAPSDLTVLLLDLWCATLGDKGAKFTAEEMTDQRGRLTTAIHYDTGHY